MSKVASHGRQEPEKRVQARVSLAVHTPSSIPSNQTPPPTVSTSLKKDHQKPGVVEYYFDPSTQEAESGEDPV